MPRESKCSMRTPTTVTIALINISKCSLKKCSLSLNVHLDARLTLSRKITKTSDQLFPGYTHQYFNWAILQYVFINSTTAVCLSACLCVTMPLCLYLSFCLSVCQCQSHSLSLSSSRSLSIYIFIIYIYIYK